ncbi:MAG: inositol monophosphatase family protein [Pseudomonadota bacterium]
MKSEKNSEFLQVALDAARAAADLSMEYYATDLEVTLKADRSPVTEADVRAEKLIRERITAAFPEHGFFGEETGRSNQDSEYLWLVDPIDGTKSFIRGYPFFSTQIALMKDGVVQLGVSAAPAMQETAWAERGSGAWLNGQRLAVSTIEEPTNASISLSNIARLAASDGWAALGEITAEADRQRGFGDYYSYHLLASGKIEAVVESAVNILDIAALSVIVEESGGIFTDLNGRPPSVETTTVLAANAALHAYYLEKLRGFLD